MATATTTSWAWRSAWTGSSSSPIPGTFTYTGDAAARNRFRGSGLHSTVVVDGEEQQPLPGGRLFALPEVAVASCLAFESTDRRGRLVVEHQGYQRLTPPVLHRRELVLDREAEAIFLADSLTGAGAHRAQVHFLLPTLEVRLVPLDGPARERLSLAAPPQATGWDLTHAVELGPAGAPLAFLVGAGAVGAPGLTRAEHSPGYLQREPATLVTFELAGELPLNFSERGPPRRARGRRRGKGRSVVILVREDREAGATAAAELIARIHAKQAVIGIVGLGYVGLPLGLAFAADGFSTLGLDVDGRKVTALLRGESYIRHIPAGPIAEGVKSGKRSGHHRLLPGGELRRVADLRAHAADRGARARHVLRRSRTGEAIAPHLRAGQLVVLESTTYPGTTDEVLRPILEARRAQGGPGLLPGLLAGAGGPGQRPLLHHAPSPRWWAAHTPSCLDARRGPLRQRDRRRWSRSPPPRWRRWPSCWRTSTAASTSPWSTS